MKTITIGKTVVSPEYIAMVGEVEQLPNGVGNIRFNHSTFAFDVTMKDNSSVREYKYTKDLSHEENERAYNHLEEKRQQLIKQWKEA